VNITFVQASAFGGSGFPSDKLGHAFITQSGSTHASGTSSKAKLIEEWVLNPDGTRHVPAAGEPANPRDLVKYQGSGYSTAAAIAPGPGGLYFSTLYPDTNADPTAPGAKILRVVYTGTTAAAPAEAEPMPMSMPAESMPTTAGEPTAAPASAPAETAALTASPASRASRHKVQNLVPQVPVWVGPLFAASEHAMREHARGRGSAASLLAADD
jgi:hypothetical protein